MSKISVKPIDSKTFEVTVDANSTTVHIVTVTADYLNKLGTPQGEEPGLITRSFEFLLARESNTSILRKFDLSVIAHYFPEYEKIIRSH